MNYVHSHQGKDGGKGDSDEDVYILSGMSKSSPEGLPKSLSAGYPSSSLHRGVSTDRLSTNTTNTTTDPLSLANPPETHMMWGAPSTNKHRYTHIPMYTCICMYTRTTSPQQTHIHPTACMLFPHHIHASETETLRAHHIDAQLNRPHHRTQQSTHAHMNTHHHGEGRAQVVQCRNSPHETWEDHIMTPTTTTTTRSTTMKHTRE